MLTIFKNLYQYIIEDDILDFFKKLQEEFNELQEKIAYYRSILADPQMVLDIIKEELLVIKDKDGDDRRTEITASSDEIDYESLIQQEDMVVR